MSPLTSHESLLAAVQLPDFWRELNPSLSIEEAWTLTAPAAIDLDAETQQCLVQTVQTEGYFQLDAVLPEAEIFRMAIGVDALWQQDFLPVFAFVYDEFWRVFQRLAPVLSALLGNDYQQLPDFWAWYVEPANTSAGWGPHRDKTLNTLRPDGLPHSLTVWVPLTDALPLNGCMSILPAHLDPHYRGDLRQIEVSDWQNIRALPVGAGSVLGWTQALLHWGGRSSARAEFPRISIACEFQSSDVPPFNQPLRLPQSLPSFPQRLALIGKQIQQYQHMYAPSAPLVALAHALARQEILERL